MENVFRLIKKSCSAFQFFNLLNKSATNYGMLKLRSLCFLFPNTLVPYFFFFKPRVLFNLLSSKFWSMRDLTMLLVWQMMNNASSRAALIVFNF